LELGICVHTQRSGFDGNGLNTSAFRNACVWKDWAACLLRVAGTFCLGRINFAHYSALAKVDISVVPTTPMFCCQSLRTAHSWTFIIAASDAVTYKVF